MSGRIERITDKFESFFVRLIEGQRSDIEREIAERQDNCADVRKSLTELLYNTPLTEDGQVDSDGVWQKSDLIWNIFPDEVVSLTLPNGIKLHNPEAPVDFRGISEYERIEWDLRQLNAFMNYYSQGIWKQLRYEQEA
jgi:hypothetical protein